MRRLTPITVAVAVAGLSIGVAACGSSSSSGGGGGEALQLTIGQIVPLTGDLSDFGPPGQKAGELALDQINSAIKTAGADDVVTLQSEDEQTDPAAATSAAKKLVSDGASCIAGAWASSDSIPVARSVSIREGVLQISPASTSAEITGLEDNGLMNRTPPADNLQGPALATFIEKELGGAKGKVVSVAGRNDSYGEGLTGFFADAWEAKGGEIAGGGPLLYDPKAASYDSDAQQIVAENPDAYVIVDFPDPFVKVGPALVRTGKWDASKTFITDGLASSDVAAESYTDGMRGTAPGTPTKGAPSEAFDKAYTSFDPKNVGRQTFDAQNFDAVILCYLAAVAAGSTDGQDMADALQDVSGPGGTQYTWEQLPDAIKALQNGDDIDYVGASGDINLDDNGDPTVGVYDELLFKNGEVTSTGQVPAEAGG
jgi:ABC-type branched-subunit amino acid transport system substrate-binding protein